MTEAVHFPLFDDSYVEQHASIDEAGIPYTSARAASEITISLVDFNVVTTAGGGTLNTLNFSKRVYII